MTPTELPLHPDLEALGFLLGTWRGTGEGDYPGTNPFRFGEELTFSHAGRPVIGYAMKSWDPRGGAALHAERGFLRCTAAFGVDAVIAHATGHVEVSRGEIHREAVAFTSAEITGWRNSKTVVTLSRELTVENGVLTDRLSMQAVGHELLTHTEARLERV